MDLTLLRMMRLPQWLRRRFAIGVILPGTQCCEHRGDGRIARHTERTQLHGHPSVLRASLTVNRNRSQVNKRHLLRRYVLTLSVEGLQHEVQGIVELHACGNHRVHLITFPA